MQILIVEDDIELSSSIAEFLELQGAECDFAYNGVAALELVHSTSFDIILLDLMLPKLNGYDVCKELRKKGCSTPILMLTAMGTTEDQLNGFQVGIDDYMVKPCPMPLLWAKIKAIHHRNQNSMSIKTFGPLEFNFESKQIKRNGISITLTPTEWKVFEILVVNNPKVVSRTDIENVIWPDQEPDPNRLNVHLFSLRKAIDKPFSYPLIKTVVGVGICIRDEHYATQQ